MNYKEYIDSPEWKAKATHIKEQRGYKCQVCGVSGIAITLHVHHNTYKRLGKELDVDLVVLCENCHKLFHENGMKPNRKVIVSDAKIKSILWAAGITYTNEDPWRYYSKGKEIIDDMAQGDWELYDRYNRVNIEIVDAACLNQKRREFKNALEYYSDYYSEYEVRCMHDYWEGWNY